MKKLLKSGMSILLAVLLSFMPIISYAVAGTSTEENEIATYSVGEINPRTGKRIIYITVASMFKLQQAKDPVFTSTVLKGKNNQLDKGDTVKNIGIIYSRAPGENSGVYSINATLDHPKYELVVTPGKLTIKPRATN